MVRKNVQSAIFLRIGSAVVGCQRDLECERPGLARQLVFVLEPEAVMNALKQPLLDSLSTERRGLCCADHSDEFR